ncbi:uncharacterized protein LOC143177253 [Calliopsis andreniformis]|uniref:uncharacterized protein LOC143177253 n=1 Tax=Calliopsis andreniformis TaxID=337506 RepID=UPI003FCEA2CB
MRGKIEGRNDTQKKMPSAEKELYMKPLLKLKREENIIERGLTSAISNMKIDSNLLKDIVHQYKELATKRQNFLSMIHKSMEDIATEMEVAKYVTQNPEEIKKLDVATYKLKLIKISQKIQDLKEFCPVQSLMEEQTEIEAELREFEPQLHKYENVQKNPISLRQSRTENRKGKQDYKEVQDFHTLVTRTGHTEDWTMEDHLYFLRMRKRCENIPALVNVIQKKCPDLSAETIVNHEAWYRHYENLREKQKLVVKEWRKQKDLEKAKNIEETDRNIETCHEEDSRIKIHEENKISVPKTAKTSRTGSIRSNNSADSNNSDKKEMIKKWRIQREKQRSMDEEQLKIQKKLKQEIENSRRNRRREKIQEALEEYRRKKSLESSSRESSVSGGQCKYDSALLKAFRKQDEEYTKRKKDLIQRSQRFVRNKTIETKKPELLRSRSCSTLMNSTEIWKEKCKVRNNVKHSSELQYVKDVPKICIRWRNEESGDLRNSLMLA